MKRLHISLLVALCTLCGALTLFGQTPNLSNVKSLQKAPIKPNDPTLPISPLVVNGEKAPEIKLGRVYDVTHRLFEVVIDNPSDKDIEYTNIIVNCNCTKIVNRVSPVGVIKAKSSLKLQLAMNAADLKTKRFFRMIRLELKGYQNFMVTFSGTLSTNLKMTYYDDPEQRPRYNIMVGMIAEPSKPWKTYLNLELIPEGEDTELVLDKVNSTPLFTAALHKVDKLHWGIEIHSVVPMPAGILMDMITARVSKPTAPKGQTNILAFQVKGVSGSKIAASTDVVFSDPKVDPVICTKGIILSRTAFVDGFSAAMMVVQGYNPYQPRIKLLTADEVELPTNISGVTFRKEERKDDKGNPIVLVFCTMDRSKMTEKGETALFMVKDALEADVRFAILGEKERAQIAAEEAQRKAEEEEQAAFEKELSE